MKTRSDAGSGSIRSGSTGSGSVCSGLTEAVPESVVGAFPGRVVRLPLRRQRQLEERTRQLSYTIEFVLLAVPSSERVG
jgi:hypothetical protein